MPPRTDTTPTPEESRPLTGLRGLAALLVMLHHFYLHLALDRHLPMLQWLLKKGYLGVDLFFVLSGFVMTMVYGTWFDGRRAVRTTDYLRFMARRAARLWPVHATMLVAILLLTLWVGAAPPGAEPTPRLVVANFAMIQAWGTSAEMNPPAWSVSTEFAAYLLFPLLAAISARRRTGTALCVLAVIAALGMCMAQAPPLGPARRGLMDLYFNYSVLPLLRCMAEFTIGMLAFRAGGLVRVRQVVSLPWVGPLALVSMGAAMLGRSNDLVILPLLPVLVLGMHFGRGPVHRALGANPLHGLGLLSYAIYLVHYVLLTTFPFGSAQLRYLLPVYCVLTWALAVLLYYVVERPGRRVIRVAAEQVFGGHIG